MSYFDEVYLKRMNKDGNTRQERILTQKERRFNELFLKQTNYQANLYLVNDNSTNILCSVQPKKWGQDKILSNLLVSRDVPRLNMGDIIYTYQKIKNQEYDKCWLVVYISDDITHGYQAYEIIELDSVLEYKDEYGRTLHTIPCKFVNENSEFVKDKFSSYGAVTYREPLEDRKIITSNFDFLHKTLYFEYNNKGWEIAGIDNTSLKNVAYISITERLKSEPEPITSEDILVGEDDNFFLNHKGV